MNRLDGSRSRKKADRRLDPPERPVVNVNRTVMGVSKDANGEELGVEEIVERTRRPARNARIRSFGRVIGIQQQRENRPQCPRSRYRSREKGHTDSRTRHVLPGVSASCPHMRPLQIPREHISPSHRPQFRVSSTGGKRASDAAETRRALTRFPREHPGIGALYPAGSTGNGGCQFFIGETPFGGATTGEPSEFGELTERSSPMIRLR
jgi:hypothetical protein